jgi:hypothetical protein
MLVAVSSRALVVGGNILLLVMAVVYVLLVAWRVSSGRACRSSMHTSWLILILTRPSDGTFCLCRILGIAVVAAGMLLFTGCLVGVAVRSVLLAGGGLFCFMSLSLTLHLHTLVANGLAHPLFDGTGELMNCIGHDGGCKWVP